MSDYDFFDEGFDDMRTEEKKSTSGESTKFPISYFGVEGTYIFRLYPENHNGKPRMRRVVWSNQLHNYRRVLTKKGDTRIDDLVQEAKDKKLDSPKVGFWRHKKSQDAIMMGYLYSAPENKNIQKPDTASAFVMNWAQLKQLDAFFESLEEEGVSLRKFLHPGKASKAIKMTIRKEKKGKKTETMINISATVNDEYELPPMEEALPAGIKFPGLDNIHVKHDAHLTDELFADFKKFYDDKVAKLTEFHSDNVQNPGDSSQEQGYQVEFDDEKEVASGN